MQKRIRLFYVLVAAFVIVACGLMTVNRLDRDIVRMEEDARAAKLRQREVESEQSSLEKEISMKDTPSYIREKARTLYGYAYMNEIRFVVVNPEVLYDADATAEVEIVEETAEDQQV